MRWLREQGSKGAGSRGEKAFKLFLLCTSAPLPPSSKKEVRYG